MFLHFILSLCTLSAKDWGATKNPVVDLELILIHHFCRILCLDVSSVLSRSTEYSTQLFRSRPQSLKIWSTKSSKKRHLCASISAHSLHWSIIKSSVLFVHRDEAQEKSSGSMKSRDGIAVEPDKLSEVFMVQQKDLLNHRKVNDRR